MYHRRLLLAAATGLVCAVLAFPALAEVDLPRAQACFDDAIATQSNPAPCVEAEQVACMGGAIETPAVATLCFMDAQSQWSAAIGAQIETIVTEAPPTIAAIARIETRYDLLSNLLQCDRMEELALVASDQTGEEILLQKTRCSATASGLTYMRLYLRSGDST